MLEIICGLWVGWMVNILADFVPRYAVTPPDDLPANPLRGPGLWRLVAYRQLNADAVIEASGAVGLVLFGVSGLAGIFAFLLLLTVIDLRYRLVPNVLIYPAVGLVALLVIAQPEHLRAALVGGGVAFGVFYLTAVLQPGKLGGGDVKLAGLIGLAFGFPGMLWVLLVGGTVGAVAAAYLLVVKRGAGGAMPYAPFLCLGVFVALLYNPF